MQPAAVVPHTEPKPDNLFGVCAALGEDFGFDPLWLRVALGAGILWSPVAMLSIYASLGVLVLATRLLIPNRTRATAARPAEPVLADAANEEVVLARAA